MSVFLHIHELGGAPVASRLVSQAKDMLAEVGTVRLVAGPRSITAWVDLDLWPSASSLEQGNLLLIAAGDPLVTQGEAQPERSASIRALLAELPEDTGVLNRTQGSFCGLRVDHDAQGFCAFTDKLGVRPLYWARAGATLYVASAQWVLDRLDTIPSTPNWQAAAEVAALGYPLGDRTLNAAVHSLLGGHLLQADDRGLRVRAWWDWSRITRSSLSPEALASSVLARFDSAVKRRVGVQRKVFSFLSGGMDSRLIASRLMATDVAVESLNFAPPGSQDLEFGRQAADVLGTSHFEYLDSVSSFEDRKTAAIDAWKKAHSDPETWPERPGLIWSGDGGSVGLGHVYLNTADVEEARRQGAKAAVESIATSNRLRLPKSSFRRARGHLAKSALEGMAQDLAERSGFEPGRNAHLFFMMNDQRRHLVSHYESIHKSRIDLVLPFFDGDFLESVIGADIDEFLEHRLYNRILLGLSDGCGAVPWQAYPGHEPCPHPIPESLRRQWQDGWLDRSTRDADHLELCKSTLSLTTSKWFPGEAIRRAPVALAAIAGLMGYRKYDYRLTLAQPFISAKRYDQHITAL